MSGGASAWSIANPGNRAARAELLAAIRAAAASQLAGDGAILDCGCGNGWLLEALAAAGVAPSRLHGIDADPVRAEAAARRVPGAAVLAGDARRLPYPDGSFELVFHVVSLSSVGPGDGLRRALEETRRVLADGGLAAVYEPRFPNPLNRRTALVRRRDLELSGLIHCQGRSLTLAPPLGRRLGRLAPLLHRRLSRLPPLRSHRLLVARR